MASYHFAVQVLGRAPRFDAAGGQTRPGSNAVKAAAYRARCALRDETSGERVDYSRKSGLQHAEILLPENAAPWLAQRELLWNRVEAMEKRRDAQLAREINMALPHEMTDAQRYELVRGFVQRHFVSRGMVADIAWHRPDPAAGDDRRNYHAHVMLTLRRATPHGLDPVKTREWNSRELVDFWRAAWCQEQNEALERAGLRARVDHRTLAAQRAEAVERGDRRAALDLDRLPEIHLGRRGVALTRKEQRPMSRDRLKTPRRQPRRERQPTLDPGVWHAPGFNRNPERLLRKRRPPALDPRDRLAPGFNLLAREMQARRERYWHRVVRYPAIDRGTRFDELLWRIGVGAEKARRTAVKLERQAARLRRKLDYWERRANYYLEGQIRGAAFRWQRARAAEEARQRRERERKAREHAARRARLVRELTRAVEQALTWMMAGRESRLARHREVERWPLLRRQTDRQQQRAGRPRSRHPNGFPSA
jgi:hypothetical protein